MKLDKEYQWYVVGAEISGNLQEEPLLKKLLNLTFAAAVLENLGPETSHIAGGVWGLINPVLDEMNKEVGDEDLVSMATAMILKAKSADVREGWLDDWGRTNGWELLFRLEDKKLLEEEFKTNHDLVEVAINNLNYDGYDAFAKGEIEGSRPEPYLGFITAVTILRCQDTADKEVGKLVDAVVNRLNSESFRLSMVRISGWPDAARPAEIMRPLLNL